LLEADLNRQVPGLVVTGHPTERLPNTLNVLFPGVLGSEMLDAVPNVWASTGSACHAGDPTPSSVLLALGFPGGQALGAVRLSLGRTTTEADVSTAARSLGEAWSRLSKGK
jgi:cysteine desulfurase